jgi:hypothetical protein
LLTLVSLTKRMRHSLALRESRLLCPCGNLPQGDFTMITRITILALLVMTFATIGTKSNNPTHSNPGPHAMCCDGDPNQPIGH